MIELAETEKITSKSAFYQVVINFKFFQAGKVPKSIPPYGRNSIL